MVNIILFLFKFLCLGLQLLKVLFYCIGMQSFLFDDSVAAGNTTNKPINLVLGHFTLFNVVLFTL
jgi:hypothetical protein